MERSGSAETGRLISSGKSIGAILQSVMPGTSGVIPRNEGSVKGAYPTDDDILRARLRSE